MNLSIKRIIKKIIYGSKSSSDSYINFLRKNGCIIGKNTYFFKPESVNIDKNRLKYISIGDNCKITEGVSIIAHDYSWTTIIDTNNEILPTGGKKICIGNNVFVGMKTMILKNVTIGDNVIIGACSVITKDIPSNSVVAGNPARIICSLDEFYKKNKQAFLDNLIYEAKIFKEHNGRLPRIEETGYFMISFIERNHNNYNNYCKLNFSGNNMEMVKKAFFETKPIFKNYNEYCEFLNKNI